MTDPGEHGDLLKHIFMSTDYNEGEDEEKNSNTQCFRIRLVSSRAPITFNVCHQASLSMRYYEKYVYLIIVHRLAQLTEIDYDDLE